VAVREEPDQQPFEKRLLADHDPAHLGKELVDERVLPDDAGVLLRQRGLGRVGGLLGRHGLLLLGGVRPCSSRESSTGRRA
jgi:hypothetical protein